MIPALGFLLVFVAGCWFVFKVHVSYTSEGGVIGMVPVLDGAFLPPIPFLIGVAMLLTYFKVHSPWWMMLVGYLLLILMAGTILWFAAKAGEKKHRKP